MFIIIIENTIYESIIFINVKEYYIMSVWCKLIKDLVFHRENWWFNSLHLQPIYMFRGWH